LIDQGYRNESVGLLGEILAKIFSDRSLSCSDLRGLDDLKKMRMHKSKENIRLLIEQLTQNF
jgi:hypothetical protein